MRSLFYFLIVLFNINALFSQQYKGYVVTIDNDTIITKIEFKRSDYDVNRLRFLQDGIVTYTDNQKNVYFPNDLLSFQIEIDYKTFFFDNINNNFFAQRLYSNKIRVNKYLYFSGNLLFTSYLIKRPNKADVSFLPVSGLSNLISRKTMLNEFLDCEVMCSKIREKKIKIKDEQAFIDFIKEYEITCVE